MGAALGEASTELAAVCLGGVEPEGGGGKAGEREVGDELVFRHDGGEAELVHLFLFHSFIHNGVIL